MTPTEALDAAIKDINQIIHEETFALYTALKKVGQDVRDTGEFQRGIKAPGQQRTGQQTVFKVYDILLSAQHSSILARGRREINGRMYGSLQWFNGLEPMLQYTSYMIKAGTDAIRY